MSAVKTWCSVLLPGAIALTCVGVRAQVPTAHLSQTAVIDRVDATSGLSVVAGQSLLLDFPKRVQRIAVGLGGFAEAVAISPTEILVNGKTPGETSFIVWGADGHREFFSLTVRASLADSADRAETVRREMLQQLPGQDVRVSAENGTVFLSGLVKDLTSSDRAVQIASVAGKVVNLLDVKVPAAQPQILLKVVFAAVDRNKSTQLGLNVFSSGLGNTIAALQTGQFATPNVTNAGSSVSNDLNLLAFFPGLNLGATIEALESKGIVQVLSQPNVLTESGKQGSFLAGGEYPYPVVQSSSAGTSVTIMFKEYGIRLNVIPTITPRGTIHLQVAPEVSSLDFTNAVQVGGISVPAIAIRKVKTEIEIGEGQSFAIGGLLDNRETQTLQKIPYISNIPVLGKFFQSISKSKTNTELIVIVTPTVVKPIPKGEPAPLPNFPEPFLAPNSTTSMHTPESQSAESPAFVKETIPVEELVRTAKATVLQGDANNAAPGNSGAPVVNTTPGTTQP